MSGSQITFWMTYFTIELIYQCFSPFIIISEADAIPEVDVKNAGDNWQALFSYKKQTFNGSHSFHIFLLENYEGIQKELSNLAVSLSQE